MHYAVIMAGGRGERFWPLGRREEPKQFLKLGAEASLLERTFLRLLPTFPPERILVLTQERYADRVRRLLALPPENVLGEPESRNTAPCIALAAAEIARRTAKTDWDHTSMTLLPADHTIEPAKALQELLLSCSECAIATQALLTIGIIPEYAATGYGYLEMGEALPEAESADQEHRFFEVKAFKEKPDATQAALFLQSGKYRWNSGMFVWTLSAILRELRELTPELGAFADSVIAQRDAEAARHYVKREYSFLPKISIDYAVMEKCSRVIAAESNFSWNDVGSFTALRKEMSPDSDGNVSQGLAVLRDCRNCVTITDSEHLLGVMGVENLVIVHSSNATLVCSEQFEQDELKKLVAELEKRNLDHYI